MLLETAKETEEKLWCKMNENTSLYFMQSEPIRIEWHLNKSHISTVSP